MLDLKIQFHGHCPKHVGYHPRDGRGAIKGGCQFCEALYRISQAGEKFIQAVTDFQELMDRYEAKRIQPTHKEIEIVQASLFPVPMEARRR